MKNIFTTDNAAMLLIDHQQGTVKLAKNIAYDAIVSNTRALARTAIETGMPLVLTSSEEDQFQGPLFEDLQQIAPEAYANRIKRPGIVDCWQFAPYKAAVEATGKKKLIMAGLTNDVCIVFPAISAIEDGYEVQVVVDAGRFADPGRRRYFDAAHERSRRHADDGESTSGGTRLQLGGRQRTHHPDNPVSGKSGETGRRQIV